MHMGIKGTVNRLNKYQLTSYHQLPMPILPIISGDDTTLCTMLFWQAHVITDVTGTVHLTRALTTSNMRCGFYGVHITHAAKVIDRLIKSCVTCAKGRIKLNISQISEKWPLQFINSSYGLWTAVAIDILGPYMYQSGPLTRQNRSRKAWLLMLVCQLTSACSIQWMNNYGAEALIMAFNAHGSTYKFPAMVTADAGSQLKATARQIAEVSGDDANDGTIDTAGWVDILSTVKRRYRATKWRIAPKEAQNFNGLTEANVKVLK